MVSFILENYIKISDVVNVVRYIKICNVVLFYGMCFFFWEEDIGKKLIEEERDIMA